MTSATKRAVLTATLPTLLALLVVAWLTLERVSVDPKVAAGWIGSSSVPVWYAPLAVFGTTHSLAVLFAMWGRTVAATAAGLLVTALAVVFHLLGLPFVIGEMFYWLPVMLMMFLPPLFILLPVVIPVAVAIAGALYGFSVYAPLAAARHLASQDGDAEIRQPTLLAFGIGGVIAAFVCVAAFGLPSEAARAARGGYYFEPSTAQVEWLRMAPVIAGCCALMALAGAWPAPPAGITSWLFGFLVPIAVVVAAGGPSLNAIDAPLVLRALNSAPGGSAVSRYFRDGRPRAAEPIRFADGELRIDRSLVRYQLADGGRRRISTVAMWPPPELQAIGFKDRIILNAWRAEPHRKEAEYRRAVCAESASRPVIECRLPATDVVVIAIDKERPERGLHRAATLDSPTGCMIIVTGVPGRSFGIRADFDCAMKDDWPHRAAEIERYFAAVHVPR